MNERRSYCVDGDDMIVSTDEWLLLVDIDDDISSGCSAATSSQQRL